jgi:hypothetical protein
MWTMLYKNIFGDIERSAIVTPEGKDPDDFGQAVIIAIRLYGNTLLGVYNEEELQRCQKIDLNP